MANPTIKEIRMETRALVVFSGGQDSTTCLFWAKQFFDKVDTVTFNYGQKHIKELDCARALAKKYSDSHIEINVKSIFQRADMKSALINHDQELTQGSDQELPSSFVPGRNLIFLGIAASIAGSKGYNDIIMGVCETDFSGYPDCRENFVLAMQEAASRALDSEITIHTPLMWLNKAQVWGLAYRMKVEGIIKAETMTCYEGVDGGCGKCPSCKLRDKGYKEFMASPKGCIYEIPMPRGKKA